MEMVTKVHRMRDETSYSHVSRGFRESAWQKGILFIRKILWTTHAGENSQDLVFKK